MDVGTAYRVTAIIHIVAPHSKHATRNEKDVSEFAITHLSRVRRSRSANMLGRHIFCIAKLSHIAETLRGKEYQIKRTDFLSGDLDVCFAQRHARLARCNFHFEFFLIGGERRRSGCNLRRLGVLCSEAVVEMIPLCKSQTR